VAYNRTVSKWTTSWPRGQRDEILAPIRSSKWPACSNARAASCSWSRPARRWTIHRVAPRVLEPGDIIIDGGNSLFEDTIRRVQYVESKGLLYIGTASRAARKGRVMARASCPRQPGGWPHVKPSSAIAAKVADAAVAGQPCCDWVGEGGPAITQR